MAGISDKMRAAMTKIDLQAQEREENDNPIVFDVYTREDQVRPEYAETCRRWSNAAYTGDWQTICEIASEMLHGYGEMANMTRLLADEDSGGLHRPSGYTVLHQAAYNNAPEEVVRTLISLGCFRTLRTTDGESQTPANIAAFHGNPNLVRILTPPPDLIPQTSEAALETIQGHFRAVVIEEAKGIFQPETMRLLDLRVMREVKKVYMPIPGMYGGFSLTWEGDHLITESECRIVGGSGRTNHITVEGAELVDEGW